MRAAIYQTKVSSRPSYAIHVRPIVSVTVASPKWAWLRKSSCYAFCRSGNSGGSVRHDSRPSTFASSRPAIAIWTKRCLTREALYGRLRRYGLEAPPAKGADLV